jgi:branched-chain amino acid transport system substrate-binding protein
MKHLFSTGAAIAALALSAGLASAQTKVTNQGISDTEIVIGTHQDLSGPIKGWGTNVANGMKMAVEEVNAAGGMHGRKFKLILEDSKYDPKTAVLATQKMIEKDKIFVNLGSMGSPTVLAAQDITLEAGVLQLFPLTASDFTFKFDPAKAQERLKFNNILPYFESMASTTEYMIKDKKLTKPCSFMQDDEYGNNVKAGYDAALKKLNIKSASDTTYKRGASDFSAQAAKLKSDGCDLVVMGAVIREPIGIMSEAKKIGFETTWLGATPINVLEIPALGKDIVEGLYAAGGFEIPYGDTAKGKVKEWIERYVKAYNAPPATQAIIGYNAIVTLAHYINKAGKDLTGQKLLDVLESGEVFQDIFSSPPTKFSKTNHLASTITSVQQVKAGRWVVVKDGLQFSAN